MIEQLTQINNEIKEIGDKDMYYILNAEIIFQWTDNDRFRKAMSKIEGIVSSLDNNKKQMVARYYAMILYKIRRKLITFSRDLPASQKRDIQHFAKWTGLGSMLIHHYMSSTNQETVVNMIWANPETAIDDMELVRDFYRSVADGSCPDLIKVGEGWRLQYRIQAAKLLIETHTNPRKKPSALINIENNLTSNGDKSLQINAYNRLLHEASTTESLSEPNIRRRIEAGERQMRGEKDVIDAEEIDETD